jgi:hypothetical protein
MDNGDLVFRDEKLALNGDRKAISRIITYERRLRKTIEEFLKGTKEQENLEISIEYQEGWDTEKGE